MAKQLNVPAPTFEDLEHYARKAGDESLMAELEKIIAAPPSGPPE